MSSRLASRLQRFVVFGVAVFIAISTPSSAFATGLSTSKRSFFAQNNILFYDPTGSAKNYCTQGGDCYIAGTTWDEMIWSALRHVGFSPEQTAGIIGNIVNEGGTPTRQEGAYNTARDRGCTTLEGTPYDIHTDSTMGLHHGPCMEKIYSGYSSGKKYWGIGLGFIQWTDHDRREGYLEKISELGLIKYFEGDAYKTYGRYSADQLKEAIVSETGSESDYWKLWCAAIKYIWTEMNDPNKSYKGFFNQATVAEYAAFTAANYERCQGCKAGNAEHNERVAAAEEYYQKYKSGVFDSVENGSAPSVTGSSSSSSKTTGKNVTVIGDSITNGAKEAIKKLLPDADIIAQDSKQLVGTNSNNPTGLEIINQLLADKKLRDIVVVALGTNNSAMTNEDAAAIVDAATSSRKVFFLTNYDAVDTTKYDNNNKVLLATAAIYENVELLDWKKAVIDAEGVATDYIKDESAAAGYAVHPTEKGAELFAKTIADAVGGVKASDTCNSRNVTDFEIYSQGDPQWAALPFGSCSNIKDSGCGPSSLAMIVTAMTGQRVTPPDIINNGGGAYHVCNEGAKHEITDLATKYGLYVKDYGTPSVEKINELLRQGIMFHVVGNNKLSDAIPFSSKGHFIAIREVTADGKWLIFDSGHSEANYKEFDPSEIYPRVHSHWRAVSREPFND